MFFLGASSGYLIYLILSALFTVLCLSDSDEMLMQIFHSSEVKECRLTVPINEETQAVSLFDIIAKSVSIKEEEKISNSYSCVTVQFTPYVLKGSVFEPAGYAQLRAPPFNANYSI